MEIDPEQPELSQDLQLFEFFPYIKCKAYALNPTHIPSKPCLAKGRESRKMLFELVRNWSLEPPECIRFAHSRLATRWKGVVTCQEIIRMRDIVIKSMKKPIKKKGKGNSIPGLKFINRGKSTQTTLGVACCSDTKSIAPNSTTAKDPADSFPILLHSHLHCLLYTSSS